MDTDQKTTTDQTKLRKDKMQWCHGCWESHDSPEIYLYNLGSETDEPMVCLNAFEKMTVFERALIIALDGITEELRAIRKSRNVDAFGNPL